MNFKKENFPHLEYLINCYFHQDYEIKGQDTQQIIDVFLHQEKKEAIKEVINDIEKLLNASNNESDVRDLILNKFNSYYEPDLRPEKLSYIEWLKLISRILSFKSQT